MTDNFDFTLWTDTEKAARIEKLRQSEPIEITGNEVPYSKDLRQYRKNAFEYGKNLRGEYFNQDKSIPIYVTGGSHSGGLKEILRHDYKNIEHFQSIAAIPQIIENSIHIITLPNEDLQKHPDIVEYLYFVVGLKIANVDYTVKAVVAVDNNGNKYYDHKLTQIEKGRLIDMINRNRSNTDEISTSIPIETNLSEYKDRRLFSILQIKIPKSIGGVELSYEQQQLLTLGEAIELNDISDKQGKKHNILVQWNIDAKKLKISEVKTEKPDIKQPTPTRKRGLHL